MDNRNALLIRAAFVSSILLYLTVFFNPLFAQMRVGQPAGSADGSAALDVSGGPYPSGSQYRGIAPPKVALVQLSLSTPVSKPVQGLLIYNTANQNDVTPGYYYWEGTRWLRFSTSGAGAARTAASSPPKGSGQFIPAYTQSQVRSLTISAADAPDHLILVDSGREGMFRYEDTDATPVDDGALTLRTSQNLLYKRVLNDGRITPQMFGAKGDSLSDDSDALLAWLNASGTYLHFLPAGKYTTNKLLTRNNRGSVSIQGSGSGVTKLLIRNNTGGIRIENDLGGKSGAITISGLEVVSNGVKTGITEAIYLKSQTHRPGPSLTDVTIKNTALGNEFSSGIHFEDCLGATLIGIDIQGASLAVTTGILVTNTPNRQSFEHNFSHIGIRNVNLGINIASASTGQFGVEGVQLDDINIVGCTQGIKAVCQGGSPFIAFRGVHINAIGGECLYIDGYQQLTFSTSDFYNDINTATGALAARAIYIKNTIFCVGEFMLQLLNNTPVGVEVDGQGGGVNLNIAGSYSSATTNYVKVASTFRDGTNFNINAFWTGNSTWGSTRTGLILQDLSSTVSSDFKIPATTLSPVNIQDPTLVYNPNGNTYRWEAVSRIRAGTQRVGYVTSTSIVDPSLVNGWTVNNGSSAIKITIDRTKLYDGQVIFINRYNNESTGIITVEQSGGAALIQGSDNQFLSSTTVPLTGTRSMYWIFNGGHLQALMGSEALHPAKNLSDVSNTTVARLNLGLGTASIQNSTAFMAASSGKLISSFTTIFSEATTASWGTNYVKVIEPGTLQDDTVYLIKLIYDKTGLEKVVQSFLVPITITFSNAGSISPDLVGNAAIYNINSGRYIKLRYTKGSGTVGLEASFTNPDMAGGLISLSLTPIF